MTGGTSFLGAHIVKRLANEGNDLTLLVRAPGEHPWLNGLAGIETCHGSLLQIEDWNDALKGQDCLIHNALLWDEEPTELQMQDVRASALLFEAAAKTGIEQIIYTSSAAVHRPWTSLMSEEDRLQPETTYGATKAANEAFLSALSHQHGFRYTILRPGAIVGAPAFPGSAFRIDSKIKEMAKLAASHQPIRIQQGDARQFVGAADLADVYSALVRHGCRNQTYVTVDQGMTQWEGIARRLAALLGSESEVILDSPPVSERRFNVSRLKSELGFSLDSRVELDLALQFLAQSQS